MIVVDASVLATALVDRGADGDRARTRIGDDQDLHAPHLIDPEVASALRRQVRAGHLPPSRARSALTDLADLPLARYPHAVFLGRVWELRDNVTPYDALYVALAEELGAVLVTADGRLASAPGLRCRTELLR